MTRYSSSSYAPYYHSNMLQNVIPEERSPSARSSMDNLHMRSPVRRANYPDVTLHSTHQYASNDVPRSVHTPPRELNYEDMTNNNPLPQHLEQQYENSQSLRSQSRVAKTAPKCRHHNHRSNSYNKALKKKQNSQDSQLISFDSDDVSAAESSDVTQPAATRDEQATGGVPGASSKRSSVATESGYGASVRGAQQENYAQTCGVIRGAGTPETVAELCHRLGIQVSRRYPVSR